jgi:hypothetical protein
VYGLQYISGMRAARKNRAGQAARYARDVSNERESMVVPRGQGEAELEPTPDSHVDFVSVPSRTLDMSDVAFATDAKEPTADAKTVVEPEEWTRARDQIALIVRSTVAEAILPLQESIAAIAERLDVLVSQPASSPPPPVSTPAPPQQRATMLPPPPPSRLSIPYVPPPMAPTALTRLGEVAGRLRRERGIDVSPIQLAAVLLERVAAVLDERVAAELARSSMLTGDPSD